MGWVKLHQGPQQETARDPDRPGRARLEAAAHGWAGANGHAPFGKNEKAGPLAVVLSTVNPADGELRPMSRWHVWELIAEAVAKGSLAPGSCASCLILPGWRVSGGLGNPMQPCRFEGRHRQVAVRQQSRPAGESVGERRARRKREQYQEERRAEEVEQMNANGNSITASVHPDDMPALLSYAAELQRSRRAREAGDPNPDRRGLRVVSAQQEGSKRGQ